MSRFYAECGGRARNLVSRCGTALSGCWGHIRGWNVGVEVRCGVDLDGKDIIEIYKTGGTHRGTEKIKLATVKDQSDAGAVKFYPVDVAFANILQDRTWENEDVGAALTQQEMFS